MSAGARRWSLRLPEQYRDLWPTFDALLRYIDDKLATISGLTWDAISGKPATFPPSAHGHPWSDITSKPTAFTPVTEDVQDIVGAMVAAGAGMTVVYDDTAGTLTLSSSASFDLNSILTDDGGAVLVDEAGNVLAE